MTYESAKQRMPEPPRQSLRVTLGWDGKTIQLHRVERVAMMAPAASSGQPEEGAVGFWIELRDREQGRLYHRVLHNPIPTHVEVFSRERIERSPVRAEPTEFDIVVPAYPEATELVVWSSPLDFKRAHETAQVIGRFDLNAGGRESRSP